MNAKKPRNCSVPVYFIYYMGLQNNIWEVHRRQINATLGFVLEGANTQPLGLVNTGNLLSYLLVADSSGSWALVFRYFTSCFAVPYLGLQTWSVY